MNPDGAPRRIDASRPPSRLLERTFRAWARAARFAIYRRVEITHPDRLPRNRPRVLAANHTNAMGDVAIIVACLPQFPRFLAAASWWRSAPARALFRISGVVPVHRARDGTGTTSNETTFGECADALRTGAHVAIFPEGELHHDVALRPLKSGAARIALGAAFANAVDDVAIMPIGLVYEHRERFRSQVEVHIGRPVDTRDFADQHATDPAKAARAVTDALTDRLSEVTVNHGSRLEAEIVDCAAQAVLADGPDVVDGHGRFARRNALRRALARAIAGGGAEPSDDRRALEAAVDAHLRALEALGAPQPPEPLRALCVQPGDQRAELVRSLRRRAVPAAFGFVMHAPLAGLATLARGRVQTTWKATAAGLAATFGAPFVYGAEIWWFARRIGARNAWLVVAAGALAGRATIQAADDWADLRRARWRDRAAAADPERFDAALETREALRRQVEALVGSIAAASRP